MIDERQALEIACSLRVAAPGERARRGERRLLPVLAGQDGEIEVYTRPWRLAAARTLALRARPLRRWGGRQVAAVARDSLAHLWSALARRSTCPSICGRFGSGAVALLRSQKVILIDRSNGYVLHLLRAEHRQHSYLLENEIAARRALPEWTLPIALSHLEQPPYFLLQPYIPYSPPSSWRQLLPEMKAIVAALFRHYLAFGVERAAARAYVDSLMRAIRAGLEAVDGAGGVPGLAAAAEMCHGECLRLLEARPDAPLFLARVHGDFIASHVVRPVLRDAPARYLVDWSESHRYPIFHDLFYFHFQNHDSDLWERFPALQEADLAEYYGDGFATFAALLAEHTGARLGIADVHVNFMICLLQELEHRLFRLHPRYLPFWVQQAGRISAAGPWP